MPAEAASGAGLPCAKCGYVNESSVNFCRHCGAHLWLECPQCGRGNERTLRRCRFCGSRLHMSWWKRLRRKLRRPVNQARLALVIVSLIVVVWLLYMLKLGVNSMNSLDDSSSGETRQPVQWN